MFVEWTLICLHRHYYILSRVESQYAYWPDVLCLTLSVPQTVDAHLLGEVEVLGLLDATEEGEDHLKKVTQPS